MGRCPIMNTRFVDDEMPRQDRFAGGTSRSGLAACASLSGSGVRNIPWDGEDLRFAEHQTVIRVRSEPARDRNKGAICESDTIRSDGVSGSNPL